MLEFFKKNHFIVFNGFLNSCRDQEYPPEISEFVQEKGNFVEFCNEVEEKLKKSGSICKKSVKLNLKIL